MQRTERGKLKKRRNRGAGALAISPLFVLAACAVSSPFTIQSTGSGIERGGAVVLAAVEEPSAMQGRFSQAVQRALTAHSVRMGDDAPLLADFSIAVGPARTGVLRGKGESAEGTAPQDWITPPRRARRFDRCKAQRLRATLVLYDRASGAVAYRGVGEGTECAFGDAQIAALAERLVMDATD